jgi:hypothetical protein
MRHGSGWSWKRWLGVAIGVAAVLVVILLAAMASGGSNGLY